MKLSLWQQFGSNHSASFTIVGRFESAAAAQQAAEELRGMLNAIEAWYRQPENSTFAEQRYEEELPPTPVEKQFAEQYGVAWNDYSIDWITAPEDTVVVLDNHVFLNSMRETWLGPQPFDAIMDKLGGATTVSGEAGDGMLVVDIDCRAPDEGTANALFETLQTYLANPIHLRVPWSPRTLMKITLKDGETFEATPEEQIEAQDWYQRLTNAANEARGRLSQSPEFQKLIQDSMEAAQRSDTVRLQAMQADMMAIMENIPEVQMMQQETAAHPRRKMTALQSSIAGFGTGALSGSISHEGLALSIKELSLYRLNSSLPLVLDYLRSHGCQDIDYRLTLKKYDMGDYGDWVDGSEDLS